MAFSSTEEPNLARPDRKTIQSLFNAITPQYDFLNSFFSVGLDRYWRRWTAAHVLKRLERTLLDLGTGTGKSLAAFLKAYRFERAVGCDFSAKMLHKAGERLGRSALLVACDFHELPFPAHTFDLVTGSFILRSVQNMRQFLSEAKRVLRPGGQVVFLELTRPRNRFVWRFLYQPYLKFYVPLAGRLFSRHDQAYRFLSESVQSFMKPEDLKREFDSAGFSDVRLQSLSFGIATMIQAKQGFQKGSDAF